MPTYRELVERVRASIDEIEVDELREQGDQLVVLDVRERSEWMDGHIPGARHVSRGLLDQSIEDAVPDRTRPIVVYCGVGNRSALAARTLTELGYENVQSLAGGLQAWKERGFSFEMPIALRDDQMTRYSRHLRIPEVGEPGQAKLLDGRVLLVGAGGLGSPAALYLAAAGVGTLGIIDDDVVDRSNLQRQVIHDERRIGMSKVDSAEWSINALNPDVAVIKHRERLVVENAAEIIDGYDIVLDGGDNFATRYLINDTCVRLRKPNVHGSVYRFEGQATVFGADTGPCYRCLYPEPPPPELAPSCQEAGVLGVVPGIVGLLQANEVLKLILGIGDSLAGRLLTFDALRTEFRELRIPTDPDCVVCAGRMD